MDLHDNPQWCAGRAYLPMIWAHGGEEKVAYCVIL